MKASLGSFEGRLFAVAMVFWKLESERVMMCPGPVPSVEKFIRPLRFVHCPASEFGLTASVWTRDYEKGRRVAEKIEAGSVCVNEVLYTHGIGQTPWGGFKNSGRGRTHGTEGLMELVQPQHIHVNRFAILPDAWWLPYSPEAVKTFRGFATKFASGSLLRTTTLMPQLFKRIRELLKK